MHANRKSSGMVIRRSQLRHTRDIEETRPGPSFVLELERCSKIRCELRSGSRSRRTGLPLWSPYFVCSSHGGQESSVPPSLDLQLVHAVSTDGAAASATSYPIWYCNRLSSSLRLLSWTLRTSITKKTAIPLRQNFTAGVLHGGRSTIV